jgi:acyl phosphate:glycerol-3-phosphate acyltransferase
VPVFGYILMVLIAYLLGSIPSGFLVAKARGVDIRTVGSGNIGATNVFRYLGKWAGACVLLADAAKGYVAVAIVGGWFCGWLYPAAGTLAAEWARIVAGLAAVLGHNYTCWLHFKGGKGIATSAGVLTALVPAALLVIFAVWVIVFAFSRYVSLASILAAFVLPFAVWLTGKSTTLIAITAAMTTLGIYRHKANIQRLLKGTENRIGGKKPAAVEPNQSARQADGGAG